MFMSTYCLVGWNTRLAFRDLLQDRINLNFSLEKEAPALLAEKRTGNTRNAILRSLQQPSDPVLPSWTVFYNVFIPLDNSTGTKNALRIVHEQIQQLQTSPRVLSMQNSTGSRSSAGVVPVVFLTIGLADVITPQFLSELCLHPLECRLAAHMSDGAEAQTLEYLHGHCQMVQLERSSTPMAPQLVTYLHNKGSFHNSRNNDNWRRALTRASVSSECLAHVEQGECNVCGLQYFLQWTPFYPGNMFTAECSYIEKLLNIHDYETKLKDLAGEVMIRRVKQEMVATRQHWELEDHYGLGRYYAEHWIGSHPDIVPCDVGHLPFKHYVLRDTAGSDLQWALSPRSDPFRTTPFPILELDRHISENRDIRLREFFGTAGQLFRWFYLYGQAPGNSSWVWERYDDGKLWRNAVMEHGLNAVQVVTSERSIAGTQPAFHKDCALDHKTAFRVESESKHAVFYKAHVPADADNSAFQLELELINKQLDILVAKDDSSLIAIDTSGHSLLNAQTFCADRAPFDCRRTGHLGSELYPGETLQMLYDYCGAHPLSRVTYLSNHLTAQHITVDENATNEATRTHVLDITAALISPSCMMESANSSISQCNLCGFELYTVPYIHMTGNMWSADCEYINKLIPPVMFAEKVKEFLVKALPLRFLGELKFNFFDDSMDVLGLEGYAMDHWVGSHPSMVPCGWQNNAVWSKGGPNSANFSGWGFDRSKYNNAMRGHYQRLLELTFLAGNALKWHVLYHELPNADSWVYQAYPDGEHWKKEGLAFVESHVGSTNKETKLAS